MEEVSRWTGSGWVGVRNRTTEQKIVRVTLEPRNVCLSGVTPERIGGFDFIGVTSNDSYPLSLVSPGLTSLRTPKTRVSSVLDNQ